MKRLPRWLGSLLSPAKDPRGPVGSGPAPSDPEALLAELRRSRAELADLRAGLRADSPVVAALAREEQELSEAEASLVASLDERRAMAALARARRRATEAELLADL